jgi:hypothetical protein
MAWKILKQFKIESKTVWVEKLSSEDTVEKFTTKKAATSRIEELQAEDSSRMFKVIKT